jgi:hypothetical protein
MRPAVIGPLTAAILAAGLLSPPAAPAAAPGGRYALLVGVSHYNRDELRSLKYAERDVESMADILRKAGYARVVLMTGVEGVKKPRLSPDGDNIREELKGLLEGRQPEDTVLVAFAGHGVQFRGQTEHYFCPRNARLEDPKSLIALTEVYGQLKGCGAGTKILLVDACRNDPVSDPSRGAGTRIASVTRPQAVKPPGGVAALFSCSEGQKAYESDELRHGVFFNFVIEGLKGKAAEDGAVDLDGLAKYVRRKVPDYVKDDIGPRADQVPYEVKDGNGDFRLIGPSAHTAGGLRPLFNGRDLTGWSGDPALWKVEGGAVVGRIPEGPRRPNTYLISERTYGDFELSYEVRLRGGERSVGNSGVQVRSTVSDAGQYKVVGPQVEIAPGGAIAADAREIWGCVVTEPSGKPQLLADRDAIRRVYKPGEFNAMTVRCVGRHIRVQFNGLTTVDDEFPSMPPEGVIALQLHGGHSGMEVSFRNVRLRALSR